MQELILYGQNLVEAKTMVVVEDKVKSRPRTMLPLLFSGAPIARDIYPFREAAREIWAVAGNKRAHYHRRRRAHFAVPQDTRRTFKMVSIIVRHSSRYPR